MPLPPPPPLLLLLLPSPPSLGMLTRHRLGSSRVCRGGRSGRGGEAAVMAGAGFARLVAVAGDVGELHSLVSSVIPCNFFKASA